MIVKLPKALGGPVHIYRQTRLLKRAKDKHVLIDYDPKGHCWYYHVIDTVMPVQGKIPGAHKGAYEEATNRAYVELGAEGVVLYHHTPSALVRCKELGI